MGISTVSLTDRKWAQTVDRQQLLAALTQAFKCVAKAQTRVDDFKCFKFKNGFVNAFDGVDGASISCEVTGEALVYAHKLYPYLKTVKTDQVRLVSDGKTLNVNGEADFPCPELDDFPELLSDDMEVFLADCTGLAQAFENVLFCVQKSATRLGIPHGVLVSDSYVYASDTKRAARASLLSAVPYAAFVPLSAAAKIAKLGDPSSLLISDRQIGAVYADAGLYFVTNRLNGPAAIAGEIDTQIADIERPAVFCSAPPAAASEGIKRLKQIVKKGKLSVRYAHHGIALNVHDKETDTRAGEGLAWPEGPREELEFAVDLDYFADALEQEFVDMDMSHLPKVLMFRKPGCHHLIALDY